MLQNVLFFFLNIELNSHADRDQASDCQIFPKLQFEVDATAHQSGAKSARHRQEVNWKQRISDACLQIRVLAWRAGHTLVWNRSLRELMRVSITTLSEPGSKISATWSLPVIHLLVIVTVVGLSCSLARLGGGKTSGQRHDSVTSEARVSRHRLGTQRHPSAAAQLRKCQRKLKTEALARAPPERAAATGNRNQRLSDRWFRRTSSMLANWQITSEQNMTSHAPLVSTVEKCHDVESPLVTWRLNLSGWEQRRCTSCNMHYFVFMLACFFFNAQRSIVFP